MKKIATIGGGTGLSTLARGLRRTGLTAACEVAAVVSMADSGGYSGLLRNERGVLPPGDLMKVLIALSHLPEEDLSFYSNRAADNSVEGHTMLVDLAEQVGYLPAIEQMRNILQCSGRVLPATLDPAHLFAETNRRIIEGEGEIEKWFYDPKAKALEQEKLLRVFLKPPCRLHSAARRTIELADLVVIGPGSFYTSLIACLQVEGMTDTLKGKKIVYNVNVTTHPLETPGWTVSDFVTKLEQQIDRQVDVVVCNESVPTRLLKTYGEEHSAPVKIDVPKSWNGRQVITHQLVKANAAFARHDPTLLARVIQGLLERD